MYKIIYIIIYIKLLLLLFNNELVNGQVFKILPSSGLENYTTTNTNYCNFDKVYVLLNEYPSFINLYSTTPDIVSTYSVINKNDNSTIVKLSINKVPVGITSLEFKLNTSTIEFSAFHLQLKCTQLSSGITISKFKNINNIRSQLYDGYVGIIKIEGLTLFSEFSSLTKNVIIKSIGSKNNVTSPQYYAVVFQHPPDNPLEVWLVQIEFSVSYSISFGYDTPIASISNNNIQINSLFDISKRFIASSQYSRPIFLFSCNNTIQSNPIFYIDNTNQQNNYVPINGSLSSTNYLLVANYLNEYTSLSDPISISSQYYSKYSNQFSSTISYEYSQSSIIDNFSLEFDGAKILIINSTFFQFSYSSIGITRGINGFTFKSIELEHPFGFVYDQSRIIFSASFAFSNYKAASTLNILFKIEENIKANTPQFENTVYEFYPSLTSYSYNILNDNQILLLFIAQDGVGIIDILLNGQYYEAVSCITQGDNLNGNYEIVFDYNKDSSVSLILQNSYYRYSNYISGLPYIIPSIQQPTTINFESPITSQSFSFTDFSYDDIKSISFLYNDIDTTGESYWNTMYLELVDSSLSKGNPIQVGFYFSNNQKENTYYLYWDSVKLQYRCDFKMPANLLTGTVEYYLSMQTKLITSTVLSSSYQLNVYSNNADLLGPVFTTFTKDEVKTTIDTVIFGWTFTIEDKVNGFKNGYIVIRGEIDKSIYNISLSPSSPSFKSGNKYEGVYQISIEENKAGISQTFIVSHVFLQDLQDQITRFDLNSLNSPKYPQLTPFLNFVNIQDSNFYRINVTKPISSFQESEFQLQSFSAEVMINTLDSIVYNITFAVFDSSGLKETQIPYVYLTSFSFDILKFSSSLIFKNQSTFIYSSLVSLPAQWGCPNEIEINIYGLVNNFGVPGGFQGRTINKKLGYSLGCYSYPSIVKLTKATYSNGVFNIFGMGLTNINSINIGGVSIFPKDSFATVMLIPYDLDSTIKTNNTVEINIYGLTTQSVATNTISFSFTRKQFKTPPKNPLLPPTNPPQQCLGNPQCGGSKQGYCTPNGCVCISPYVSNDCSSKIVTVPPPSIDTNQPNTTIEVPAENSNDNVQSIITVIGLREVDLLTNKEIAYHPLNNWLYSKEQNSNISLYQSSITHSSIKTNVNVSLEWFTEESSITFANQNLTMLPSSMKYTVSISQYSFFNNFCALQVIMLAQIKSNNNNVCSYKDFGNTTNGDNSNFIKLQVDKNSFYGRFIKRGIIDSQIRAVENVLLDSSFKTIDSTNNKQQSYIGIVIPRYLESAIIDPDFSHLLETDSATSLCKDKNGLSKGAIIGIVVGCAGGAIVIVIAILLIKKYKYHIKNIKNNIKLKKMNNL